MERVVTDPDRERTAQDRQIVRRIYGIIDCGDVQGQAVDDQA